MLSSDWSESYSEELVCTGGRSVFWTGAADVDGRWDARETGIDMEGGCKKEDGVIRRTAASRRNAKSSL